MAIRDTILGELTDLFEEEEIPIPEISGDTVLLDTGLDSLALAVLVTRLEESLGYDPFTLMDEPVYVSTFAELVSVYEQTSSLGEPAT
jgi:hypothetical protein